MLTGGRGGCKRQNFLLTPSGAAALAGGSVLWKWPLGAELCHTNKTVNDKTSLRMTKRTGRAALPHFLHKVCFSRQIQFMILSSFRWQTARSDPSPCLTSGQRVSAVSVLSFRFSFSRRPSSALTQLSQPKNPLEKFYFCLLWLAFCLFDTHSLLRIHAEQLYAPFFFSFFFFYNARFRSPPTFQKRWATAVCLLHFGRFGARWYCAMHGGPTPRLLERLWTDHFQSEKRWGGSVWLTAHTN